MNTGPRIAIRIPLLLSLILSLTLLSTRMLADTGTCGGASVTLPFTDVAAGNVFFCSIAGAFFSGLSNGTDGTHYSPAANVPREQMAAFVTRTLDQSLKRGSRRASIKQWWTPTYAADGLGLISVGSAPQSVASDGADLWVANFTSNSVSRVRASDGKLLETWTGTTSATGVLVARGLVFVTGSVSPGQLYQIDPTQPAGPVTGTPIGNFPNEIAFDGHRVWTANGSGSVSIVTLNPLAVTTVSAGFLQLFGILYDGTNIWVADGGDGTLKKLDSNANILQAVTVGAGPQHPTFDGTNIWVPNGNASTMSVVRAAAGVVLTTLMGNGLDQPTGASFDGERILVTNSNGNSISLWKASDFSPLGSVSTGAGQPIGSCSDGLNFWITLDGTNRLARF